MDREQLIRALRKYARKRDLPFQSFTGKGKGSHHVVELGAERTTTQDKLAGSTGSLKQLKIDPATLQRLSRR